MAMVGWHRRLVRGLARFGVLVCLAPRRGLCDAWNVAQRDPGPDDPTESDGDATVLVTTVIDDPDAAAQLAVSVVRSHLAACTQTEGPLRSTYRWDGEIRSDEEWRVVAKTTSAGADALVAAWEAEHPYDVPEIIVVPVSGGHEPYLRWVATEVLPESRQ